MNEALLSIDVEAEIYKLSVGRLSSREQAPVALVRMAAFLQASRVGVSLSKSKLKLEHDGSVPSWAVIHDLKTLLDKSHNDFQRHEALVSLEKAGMLDLLVAISMDARHVVIDLGSPIKQCIKIVRGARSVKFQSSAREKGMSIEIKGGNRNFPAENNELVSCLKYAQYRIEINGQSIDRGLRLEDAMFETRFQNEPFTGVLGLPRQGLAAVTRILVRGVLEKEIWLSPKDGMVWEAVVEAQEGTSEKQIVENVRKAMAQLYTRARNEFDHLGQRDKQRIKKLLFRLADFGGGVKAVNGVKMFKTVSDRNIHTGAIVRNFADRVVRAIGSMTERDKYFLLGNEMVLKEQERGFIERHMKLMVREPTRQPKRTILNSVTKYIEAFRAALLVMLARLTVGKVVAEDKLSTSEKEFLNALRKVVHSGLFLHGSINGVAFANKRWGVALKTMAGRSCGYSMILSRKNSRVKNMVRAFERDRKSLYASLMLLADGKEAVDDSSSQLVALLLRDNNHIRSQVSKIN